MSSKTKQVEATSVKAEVANTASENAVAERTVVVLAFDGTEEQMLKIWERNCGEKIIVKSFNGQSLKELLEDIIADNEISNEFALIPANLIPVMRTRYSVLAGPYVDCYGKQFSWWGRVPVLFTKETLAVFLPENDQLPEDDFVKKYIKDVRTERALIVSHEFGNFYTKVLRANPCENVIIEAFINKRFIYANKQGWQPVVALYEKLSKND